MAYSLSEKECLVLLTLFDILDNTRAQSVGELQEDLCKALCISYPPILCESHVSQKRAWRVFVRLCVSCPQNKCQFLLHYSLQSRAGATYFAVWRHAVALGGSCQTLCVSCAPNSWKALHSLWKSNACQRRAFTTASLLKTLNLRRHKTRNEYVWQNTISC